MTEWAEIERAARSSYGRLLAYLATRSGGDLAACEDALGDAFVAALERWGQIGIPDRPEAWLFKVAKNRLLDRGKRVKVEERAVQTLLLLHDERAFASVETSDAQLRMMFVCAHPAIAPNVRTPLMLQAVLGLTAEAVAQAFMVPTSTMAKRLVRAKAKIKRAKIPFELPVPEALPDRRGAVLDAIYAAYGRSWHLGVPDDGDVHALRSDALHLAEVATEVMPDEPEAQALLALLLFGEARASARRPAADTFCAFDDQDLTLWDEAAIDRAESHLREATAQATFGRFQIEAALQSCHVARRLRGIDNFQDVERLYAVLNARFPSLGAWLGWCAAHARVHGPRMALAKLKAAEGPSLAGHQPYWALRADLHRQVGQSEAAQDAYRRAVALTADPAIRRWIVRRSQALTLLSN
ncbi:MAG: DUF6596 domain-containing protein [Myxococcota bacterium]